MAGELAGVKKLQEIISIYPDVWGRCWGSDYDLWGIRIEGGNPLKIDPRKQHLKKKHLPTDFKKRTEKGGGGNSV